MYGFFNDSADPFRPADKYLAGHCLGCAFIIPNLSRHNDDAPRQDESFEAS